MENLVYFGKSSHLQISVLTSPSIDFPDAGITFSHYQDEKQCLFTTKNPFQGEERVSKQAHAFKSIHIFQVIRQRNCNGWEVTYSVSFLFSMMNIATSAIHMLRNSSVRGLLYFILIY